MRYRIAARSRLRRQGKRQRHFDFPFVDYQPCRFPLEDNPHAMEWLLKGLPNAARTLVMEYREEVWPLILYLDRFGSPALELFQTNPVLAHVLFCHKGRDLTQGVTLDWHRELRRDLRGRQRDLLPWFGLPAEERMARFMRKMDASTNWLWLDELSLLPKMATLKVAGHLPRIDMATWEALQLHGDGRVTASFVLEVARNPSAPLWQWGERMRVLRDLSAYLGQKLPEFRDLAHVKRTHDRLATRVAHMESPADSPTLSSLPFPGTSDIQPLLTEWDYLREGLDMRHCVHRRWGLACEGKRFHYRVLAPERATLEIAPHRSGRGWRLSEMRCRRNRTPRASTWQSVSATLRQLDPKVFFG